MDSYKRFRDENYKNWLKTAESLCILRRHIRDFVENETETFHTSLRKHLENKKCTSNCTFNTGKRGALFPICDTCELWKNAILDNHNSKKMKIYWNNSEPHLWHDDKWEVAKVYMIRGVKDHHSFEQFDMSSILNFMNQCKHFARFKKGLPMVISVRNKVMHSPDFRFTTGEMTSHINYVLNLAKNLETHIPGLKTVPNEIEQFSKVLERYTGEDSQPGEDSKLLNREQAALKEKIEFLTKCFEEDNPKEFKEELLGMRTFVDQNKDLLENLGPQISQINVLQEKVEDHEKQITEIKEKVEQLVTEDPGLSGASKYKNHVLEEAQKRKMPAPVFGEDQEANGYRGVVEVNGKRFKGLCIKKSKIEAHQDVAKIALDFMKSNPEWTEELSSSEPNSVLSGNPPNFKSLLFEEARKKKIPEPVFKEEQDTVGSGFRGVVEADNQTFKGSEVWKTKKEAHQDVAKIALDFLKSNPERTEEPSSSGVMLSCDPPKFKNHLFEEAQKRKMTDPVFSEEKEANGFRGVVEVNNKKFKGSEVWKTKKEAHQDVAKIALDFMKSSTEETEELSSSEPSQSTTSITTSNPVLSGNPPKFKNHLFEEAQKRKIPDPVFTEEQEANGFICVVDVNNKRFKGSVCKTKKEAHQDVAKIALDFMRSNSKDTEEHSSSEPSQPTTSSSTSSSGFRGVVKVDNNTFKGSGVCKTKKVAHQDVPKVALDAIKSQPEGREESPSVSEQASQSTSSNTVSKIDELLALYDLSPPYVTAETVQTEKNFSFQLHINLDKFTFQTSNTYKSKKEGISKMYGLLGQALGILPPSTDEKQATMLVKQHFTQKSVAHPKEEFKNNMCFLHEITYNLVYEGQGSTEAEAKQDALQKAHCTVPLLFGHSALPKLNSPEETEAQINNLLKMNGQKDLTLSEKGAKYKSSIKLQFSNYIMENRSERTKKANRNDLSGRILLLLGKELDPDSKSIQKNVLDQWFTQMNLERPLFEDTGEAQGSKVTLTAPMSCSHPAWEDSAEAAQLKLIQELTARFTYLTEKR